MAEKKTLLTIDVGNTNITIGLFRGSKLIGDWRLSTDQHKTRDELGSQIQSLLESTNPEAENPEGIVISSVVPYLNRALKEGLKKYMEVTPRFLKPKSNQIISIQTQDPCSVGSDRIANCIAAWRHYGGPGLIVDFGTATSFDLYSESGDFLGGAIAPEMEIAMEALYQRAALLPEVELEIPDTVIGKSTSQSMTSGFALGFLYLIEGMIRRFNEEYGSNLVVTATGGKGQIFWHEIDEFDHYEEYLVLNGLRIWYQETSSNQKQV